MLENFLKKLGANTKITVGVSISPGLGLEMVEIDRNTKMVSKYGFRPLEYNYSTREIMDYGQFQFALTELFDELRIPRKSNITLNIPNVHFGTINLPLLLTDDAITNAIVSEVEQSYIFKRQEPVVSWVEASSNIDTESRALLYTAMQQSALDNFKSVCAEVGCNIVAIETSYSSFLKALYYADLAKEQMKDNITWNLMIVGQNHYSIFSLVGKKIIDYYEEPLALKSFVGDEIYNAITSSAQLTLAGLPANYLYIASETDLVSAEVLAMKMPFEGKVIFLECNKYTQNELMSVNLNVLPNIAVKITPEAVGIGVYQFCDYPLKFNLTGEKDAISADVLDEGGPVQRITIGGVEVELTPEFVQRVVLVIGAIFIIPLALLAFAITGFVSAEQSKLTAIETKITQANEEVKKYSGDGTVFDQNLTIEKISSQNRTEIFYYSALRSSVPSKLWITYYMTDANKKVDIKGRSSDVESVYAFYKNLKQLVTNSDVRLYKLEIVSDSLDDVVENFSDSPKSYEFEITNMTSDELNPVATGDEGGKDAKAGDKKEKNMGKDLQKALFSPENPLSKGADAKNPDEKETPAGLPSPKAPAAPTPAGSDQLPKNLQSIEKF